jgi:hypothetical protein
MKSRSLLTVVGITTYSTASRVPSFTTMSASPTEIFGGDQLDAQIRPVGDVVFALVASPAMDSQYRG